MAKLPWFKFYAADWLSDAALGRCSLAARGAAMEIFCLMWQSDERGRLVSKGKPWCLEDIVRTIRGQSEENRACVHELLDKGVLEQGRRGEIYSKRMVRDEETRDTWKRQKRSQRTDDVHPNVHPNVQSDVRSMSAGESEVRESGAESESESGAESLKFSNLENYLSSSNTGQTATKKWVNYDEERRRKSEEAADRVFGKNKKLDANIRGNVPKKPSAE